MTDHLRIDGLEIEIQHIVTSDNISDLADALGIPADDMELMLRTVETKVEELVRQRDRTRIALDYAFPKRSSRGDYPVLLAYAIHEDEPSKAEAALRVFYDEVGWRGPLDILAGWITEIHALAPAEFRNAFGYIDFSRLVVVTPDSSRALGAALQMTEKAEAEQDGLDLREAFKVIESIGECKRAWQPYIQRAFQAAATDDSDGIFPALAQCPERKNEERISMIAAILSTPLTRLRNENEAAAYTRRTAALAEIRSTVGERAARMFAATTDTSSVDRAVHTGHDVDLIADQVPTTERDRSARRQHRS